MGQERKGVGSSEGLSLYTNSNVFSLGTFTNSHRFLY